MSVCVNGRVLQVKHILDDGGLSDLQIERSVHEVSNEFRTITSCEMEQIFTFMKLQLKCRETVILDEQH